jgi:hypothetical protein
MFLLKSRREREADIVQKMIKMYCKAHHNAEGHLCIQCDALSVYSEKRALSCMYGDIKPVCKECPVHCYTPQKREQIKQVMTWAGPKMIFRNPLFAITHIIDNLTSAKPKSKTIKRREK